jgi:DNA-binding Xre family transcriptional regulator
MIKTQQQYHAARAELQKLNEELSNFSVKSGKKGDFGDYSGKIKESHLLSQALRLQRELSDYSRLTTGKETTITIKALSELPLALIKARIGAGLTQKQLGERLGVAEQQIQRYEQTEYASVSFSRLLEVMAALGVEMKSGSKIVLMIPPR